MSKLNPIYCSDLIKVGGRLQNSDLKFENIHQIILPYDHHVTNLIIENIHKSNHHIGRSQVLATLRRKFWIIKGMSNVRKVLNKCFTCRKFNSQPKPQIRDPCLQNIYKLINHPFQQQALIILAR